jgi:DNA-binding transcriptional LysR family regulator
MRADLRAYEIFMAVCDVGSMTGASKRLRITQAAVSQQIRKLEAALGPRLLDRSSRGVVVTAPDLACGTVSGGYSMSSTASSGR